MLIRKRHFMVPMGLAFLLYIISFLIEPNANTNQGSIADKASSAPEPSGSVREYVTVDKANSAPTQSEPGGRETLLRIPAGERVAILGEGSSPGYDAKKGGIGTVTWFKVEFGGETGWLSEYCTMGDVSADPGKPKPVLTGGAFPLHEAALEGSYEAVKTLLESGTDPNSVNESGETPLISLFRREERTSRTQIAVLLVRKGARISAEDKEGYTPLHWASMTGHLEAAQFLISKGADVNAKSNSGRSPLLEAASNDEPELVILLLSRGARIDEENSDGQTPLHLAALLGYSGVAKSLVKEGANVNARTATGMTPLGFAVMNKNEGVAEILRQNGGEDPLNLPE